MQNAEEMMNRNINLFERIWMVKPTCFKGLEKRLCRIPISAYLKVCNFADTSAVRLTNGLT